MIDVEPQHMREFLEKSQRKETRRRMRARVVAELKMAGLYLLAGLAIVGVIAMLAVFILTITRWR